MVGEGLNFATNYVKEENERKKEEKRKEVLRLEKEKEASRLAAIGKPKV